MFAWALGNTLMAGLLAVVLVGLERVLRSRPALLHLLWVLVLGVLLMPAIPGVDTPGNALRRSARAWVWPADVAPAVEVTAPHAAPWDEGVTVDPLTVGTPSEPGTILPESGPRPAPEPIVAAVRADWPLATWAALVWLAGACFVLGRGVQRVLGFQRLVRHALPVPAALEREVRTVARRLGVRAPRVRSLAGVASPSIWCLGRPVLLWPRDVATESASARSALLAHELAHLARRDHWVSWLEVPAAALFWWNPLFWWIRGHVRRLAELSCDAWAVWAYPADRRLFAEALIELQARSASAPVALQGLGATDSECKDFERRLDMIMRKKRVFPGVSRGVATAAALAALLAAPGLSRGAAFPGGGDGEACEAAAATSVLRPHVEAARWLHKAEWLMGDGQEEEAQAAFEKVLELDPGSGRAHGRLGYLLVGAGEPARAAEHFERQYALGHERSTALYNLACAAALRGDSPRALEYVAAAVRHGFANVELMRKDTDLDSIRAAAAFAEQLERAEQARDLRHELERLDAASDAAAFAKVHGQLAALLPADGELQSEHGHLALRVKDHASAEQAFGRQAEVGHEAPTAFYNRACARSLQGNLQGALADLQHADELGMQYAGITEDHDLDNVRGATGFAALQARIAAGGRERKELEQLVKSGDLAAARPGLKTIAMDESRSAKERSWALQTVARSLLDEGRPADAYAVYEKAAGLGAGLERCAFGMAEALARQEQYASALDHVGFAVDLGFSDVDALETLLKAHPLGSADVTAELVERAAKAKAGWGEKAKGKDKQKAWAKGLESKEKSKDKGLATAQDA